MQVASQRVWNHTSPGKKMELALQISWQGSSGCSTAPDRGVVLKQALKCHPVNLSQTMLIHIRQNQDAALDNDINCYCASPDEGMIIEGASGSASCRIESENGPPALMTTLACTWCVLPVSWSVASTPITEPVSSCAQHSVSTI